ncbi:hypothetical protein F5Y16DRAFT_357166 [Xylariaceae sp. FL0255]|nr:hypothetical protein F5Y16DRAFT_357166 [Xylariaceae sp. FL0255]
MGSAVVRALRLLAVALALPAVLASIEGRDMNMDPDMNMDMNMGVADQPQDLYPPTYFAHPDHVTAIYVHIALMVLAWVFILPTAVMLSIARSRHTLVVQFIFLVANAVGIAAGIGYNANTPDLYPGNAHHSLGWIVTWIVSAQIVVGLVGRLAGAIAKPQNGEEQQAFIPVSTEAMAEHQRIHQHPFSSPYRQSNDSGQGTEPNTESLRSNSVSTMASHDLPIDICDRRMTYDDEDEETSAYRPRETRASGAIPSLVAKIASGISGRTRRVIMFSYNLVDRTILILGYVALCTGIIAYARFFEGHEIFSGLAHWIKGGIFFWLGILTLGRWAGSFGELGWAWNVRPKQSSQRWRPTAEFVEGALIFTYGSTNVFLEHLGSSEASFSAEDLEHLSITILFIGGGLLAMLIESTRIRELLNMTVTEATLGDSHHTYSDEEKEALEAPESYEFSINPIPALVILLLGIMMSSHTQPSMTSSMIHKQWGNLLTGASFARGFTYVLLYLKPPRSVLPSRPPTELLASFGLISGGTLFMASSSDTVAGMIHYNLDAMFFYTVTMGAVGLLMAWVVVLLAVKGLAVRREALRNHAMRSARLRP